MKSSVTLFLLLCLISGCNQKTPSGNNGKTKKISVDFIKRPVLTGKTDNEMIHINVADDSNMKNQISVKEVEIFFNDKTGPANLSAIRVFLSKDGSGSHGKYTLRTE